MHKVGRNSVLYENVYLISSGTVCGKKEHEGPLGKYFDKAYEDNYAGCDSWEKSEQKMLNDAIEITLSKEGITEHSIDLYIGGDLNNQLGCTNYVLKKYNIPYLGVYAACSTLTESLLLGAMILDGKYGNNILCSASSHNSTSERQFRYPTEYGGQKPSSLTTTATGCGVALLSNKPSYIKITKATIGKVVESCLTDAQDLGRAMAPACAETLRNHLHDFACKTTDYDLILTGDLSTYGSACFKKMVESYGIHLGDNYKDSGMMLYDLQTQHVHAGGSGCGCISLVTLGYLVKSMYENKYNKVLIIATGVFFLLSSVFNYDDLTVELNEHYERYEEEYGMNFKDLTSEKISNFTEEERTKYNIASAQFAKDEAVIDTLSRILTMTLLILTFGILFAILIVEFFVPLIFKNGQTLGKKMFGICVMMDNGVRIRTMPLFIRTLLGKFTVETMIFVYGAVMLYFGQLNIFVLLLVIAIFLINFVLIIVNPKNLLIHDALSYTVVVDKTSQMIFNTEEELIKYKQDLAVKEARSKKTF